MKLYWQERRKGQSLILEDDNGQTTEMGAARITPRGVDAFATTNTYDPGRSQKGIPTMDEAKEFVLSFRPWELFIGPLTIEVEPEVRPASG